MKKIYILRHAEAISGYDDFARELSSNGYRQATTLGKILAEEKHQIDKIISSAAVRTLRTAELLAKQINFDTSQIRDYKELYNATVRVWLRKIQEIEESIHNVLLVGHNPHISYLVELLSGEGFEGLGTAHLALLETDEQWQNVSEKTAKLLKIYQ
ncbi:MAG: histidine phosphatase family protein [Raineya sp.]